MRPLSERELGYIAGIIDGEGTINLSIQQDSRNRKHISTGSTVRVATTNKELSSLLYRLLDGNKGEYRNNGIPTQIYYWSLRSPSEIGELFRQILPSMIVKREQAGVFLGWLKIRKTRRKPGEPIPQSEINLIKKLRELNRKRGNPGKPDSFMSKFLRDTNTRNEKP